LFSSRLSRYRTRGAITALLEIQSASLTEMKKVIEEGLYLGVMSNLKREKFGGFAPNSGQDEIWQVLLD